MNHPSLLVMDTLGDRKEIHHLLGKLSPRARVAFLAWCCSRVEGVLGKKPVASSRMAPAVETSYRCDRADSRLTNEVYSDLLVLAAQYGLDLAAAAAELEGRVRRPGASPRPSSRP